ncbi:MAG: RHS repeat-associated core domain-containing protein [Planctomycetota bacterium]
MVLTNDYDIRGLRIGLEAAVDGAADFANAYGYDDRGFLTSLTQTGTAAGVSDKHVTFAYDDQRRLTSLSRFADAAGTLRVSDTNYVFDDESQLTSLTHTDHTGSATLHGYTFTYDDRGRLTGMTSPDGTVDYDYDYAGQLTAADHSTLTDESYAYDDTGNRTTVTNDDGSASYTTTANNRLQSDGTYSYLYDAEGNRTRKTTIATGDYVEYAWDHRNRMTSATFYDSLGVATKAVTYTYDAFDRRIGKSVDDNGDATTDREYRYVYDSGPAKGGLDDVVLTFDGAGNVLTRHLHGPGLDNILAVEDVATGAVQWALTDHLGSVRGWAEYDGLIDTTTITATATFDSYGILLSTTGSTPDVGFAYGYTGQEWDADIGLSYYYARWYDPTVGRFISEDPIGFAGGDVDTQRYIGNSVVTGRDPSGLQSINPFNEHQIDEWNRRRHAKKNRDFEKSLDRLRGELNKACSKCAPCETGPSECEGQVDDIINAIRNANRDLVNATGGPRFVGPGNCEDCQATLGQHIRNATGGPFTWENAQSDGGGLIGNDHNWVVISIPGCDGSTFWLDLWQGGPPLSSSDNFWGYGEEPPRWFGGGNWPRTG